MKTAPAAPSPAAALIDSALAGKASTAADLAKLVAAAAKAESEAEYWRRLQGAIARDAMKRFLVELRDGIEAILSSLRPALQETAAHIAAAAAVVDIAWTAERSVAHGTPEQLAAWQQLPPPVSRVDRIAEFVGQFGRRGSLPLLDGPGDPGVELRGLKDEALFLTDGHPWRASDAIRARRADWRTSPWLWFSPMLNSLADARERLRVLAEAEFDAFEASRAERGRRTENGYVPDPKRRNPFSVGEQGGGVAMHYTLMADERGRP